MSTGKAGPTIGRPPEMYLGAGFLTLAALPLILVGGGLALQVGAAGANLRQRITETGSAADVGSLVLVFRLAGVVLLVVGLALAVCVWMALRPRRRARTVAAALAAIEMALLIFAMIVTTVDPVSLGLTLIAGAGIALLYLPRCEEFLIAGR